MQQIEQQIRLFHSLFLISMGLGIFFLVLGVVFFFKFDIPNIFNIRTGRSLKKRIKEMEEVNACTGRLRRQTHKTLENLASGQESTEVLKHGAKNYSAKKAQEEVDDSYGRFEIQSGIMLIHTDEAI